MTSNESGVRRRAPRRLAPVAAVLAVVLGLGPAALVGAGAAAAAPPPTTERPTFVLPETGDMLEAFSRSEYDEQGGTPLQTASPDVPGQQALRFSLDGGEERTELRLRVDDQTEGDVAYYTYGARLADDFPTDVDNFQVVLQWHQYGSSGSPPIAVEVRGNRVMLASEGENLQDLGPVSGGDRLDLSLRIAFSRDAERGRVDVWRDGRRVLRDFHPPGGTLLDQGNYMKVGLYRATTIQEPATLWVDDLRIGPTLASVRAAGSASETITEDAEPGTTPDAPAADPASNTVTWIAGGLLVVVVLLAAGALRRSRARS